MSIRLRRTDGQLDSHAARAELVDYIATLRNNDGTDVATALGRVADDLSAILRRWDIAGPDQGRGAERCQ